MVVVEGGGRKRQRLIKMELQILGLETKCSNKERGGLLAVSVNAVFSPQNIEIEDW